AAVILTTSARAAPTSWRRCSRARTTCRCASPVAEMSFGPGDLNWNRIVPGTIRSVVRGERPVIRSDGKLTRDYLFVDDGAGACLGTAEARATHPELRGEASIFSREPPLPVLQLVERILKVANRLDLEPEVRNEATHEIREQYLSSEKARKLLGWLPPFLA